MEGLLLTQGKACWNAGMWAGKQEQIVDEEKQLGPVETIQRETMQGGGGGCEPVWSPCVWRAAVWSPCKECRVVKTQVEKLRKILLVCILMKNLLEMIVSD